MIGRPKASKDCGELNSTKGRKQTLAIRTEARERERERGGEVEEAQEELKRPWEIA